jgi:hypothetical protein
MIQTLHKDSSNKMAYVGFEPSTPNLGAYTYRNKYPRFTSALGVYQRLSFVGTT